MTRSIMKKTKTIYKLHSLIHDMSSQEYHGTEGTYSSTQLKDMLLGEHVFIKKHITKEVPRLESEAFDIGTYIHSSVLEPHNLKNDCCVFPGKIRRGKEWDIFKEKNTGKAIITMKQKQQAEAMVESVLDSEVATKVLKGKPEVSLFVQINIQGGKIYAPAFNKILTKNGWADGNCLESSDCFKIVVKVRADILGKNLVADLKSTTGDALHEHSMREKISMYKYDLSASLYLDIFNLMFPSVKNFWWVFVSKDHFNCKSYIAKEETILVGRAKYMHALHKIAFCANNNWELIDEPGSLAPLPYELEWIKENDIDLL
jgi:hypothetical protein